MKSVFIFPPQWDIHSPSTGIPTLMGVLSEMGVECIGYDLNIDFFNYILKSKYVIEAIEKSKKIIENADNKYTQEKINYIKKNLDKFHKYKNIEHSINQIDNISNLIKDKNSFNNYKAKAISQVFFNTALDILSLPYYPYKLSANSFCNIKISQKAQDDYSCFKGISEDKDLNIFLLNIKYPI